MVKRRLERLKQVAARCLEDHRTLRSLLRSVEEVEAAAGPSPDARRGVSKRLEEMAHRLREHFAWEEESDLYTAFPEYFPRFGAALERLRLEHEKIVRQVLELRAAYRSEAEIGGCDLATRLHALAATIRRHESEENEILQRAYCEDLGPVD